MLNDSAATGLILKDNEPWRFQNSDLYYAFMETMQLHTAEAQIFDTISDYIQHCSDTLDIIRGKFDFCIYLFFNRGYALFTPVIQ